MKGHVTARYNVSMSIARQTNRICVIIPLLECVRGHRLFILAAVMAGLSRTGDVTNLTDDLHVCVQQLSQKILHLIILTG